MVRSTHKKRKQVDIMLVSIRFQFNTIYSNQIERLSLPARWNIFRVGKTFGSENILVELNLKNGRLRSHHSYLGNYSDGVNILHPTELKPN